mmetsp:Transcript_46207/g.150095  ORF Transcript_46207/g.150095 Transcript_46207/m.150095 type:complete len:208 (-) Transcript_46207:170-793(-)
MSGWPTRSGLRARSAFQSSWRTRTTRTSAAASSRSFLRPRRRSSSQMGCTATLRTRASRGHGRTTRCLSCSLQRTSARPPRRASTRALRRTSATRGAQSDALWVAWCLRGSPAGTHALGAPSARSLHAFGPPSVRSRLCRTPSAWSQSRRPHRNQHRKSASANPAPRKQAAAVRLCRETSRSSTRKNSAAAVVASNSPGCRATALGN